MSSVEVASIMEEKIFKLSNDFKVKKIPMADGGEGTVDAFITAIGGKKVYKSVMGPMGNYLESFYGILSDDNTAIIEMAAASGLPLVTNSERNPLLATSYGIRRKNKKCRFSYYWRGKD